MGRIDGLSALRGPTATAALSSFADRSRFDSAALSRKPLSRVGSAASPRELEKCWKTVATNGNQRPCSERFPFVCPSQRRDGFTLPR